jgi:hypothetical protein
LFDILIGKKGGIELKMSQFVFIYDHESDVAVTDTVKFSVNVDMFVVNEISL